MNESIQETITNWLKRDRTIVTPQEKAQYDFCLRIEHVAGRVIPFFIWRKSNALDQIVVYWGWQLTSEYVKSLEVTGDEIKKNFYRDLQAVAFLTNTRIYFKPDINTANLNEKLKGLNLEEVRAMKVIYQDGLTKDRLMDSIQQVMYSFTYIMYLFEKHGFTRPQADSFRLVE